MKLSLNFSKIGLYKSKTCQFTPEQKRILKQSLLIQEQGDLLANIWKNSSQNKNILLSTELNDMSFQGTDSSSTFLKTFSFVDGQKLRSFNFQNQEYFRQSLDEIRSRCSRKTYNLVRDCIYQQAVEARNQKKLEREIRHNQELINRIQRLTKQKIELENKLKDTKCLSYQRSEKSFNVSKQSYIDCETSRIKFEKSLILKEKAGLDLKKCLQKQLKIIIKAKRQNEQLKQEIKKLYDRIIQKDSFKDSNKRKQLKSLLDYNKKSNQRYQKQKQQMLFQLYSQFQKLALSLKKAASTQL